MNATLGYESKALAALIAAFALGAAACSDPNPIDAGTDVAWIDYQLGVGSVSPDGGYVELQPGDRLPLRLGFQGFTFARVVFTARGDVPAHTPGRASFIIDGYDPITQIFTSVDFTRGADGVWYSAPTLIFANDVLLSAIQNRPYQLTVRLSDGQRRTTVSSSGVVYYEASCVDDGDGGCVPPDGGAEPAPDAAIDASCAFDASDGTDATGCEP